MYAELVVSAGWVYLGGSTDELNIYKGRTKVIEQPISKLIRDDEID